MRGPDAAARGAAQIEYNSFVHFNHRNHIWFLDDQTLILECECDIDPYYFSNVFRCSLAVVLSC